MLSLFDYQQAAVDDLRGCFAQGFRAPLLVLPTGGGKTVIFTFMAMRAYQKGLRVLLLGHRRELIGQMSDALKRWQCPHGIVTPDAKPSSHAVQVGMVQTLANRVKLDRSGRYRFDLVIIDEAHHATQKSTWGKVLAHNHGAKLLGVSATPCRLDGKGLGIHAQGFFDSIVVGPSVSALIEQGRLARPVIYGPAQALDLDGVKKRGGDFVTAQLVGAVDKSAITGDAVTHYRKHAHNRSAIAFTVTVEHAGHVVEQFKKAGYQAAVLTGSTPDKERSRMIRDLSNGSLQVLASCNVVSEGTDIPAVFAAILLRPTDSYALAMQQIGRALRCYPDKERAIILDHADNVRRHGMPTDAVEWSLDGLRKKNKKGAALMKVCVECRAFLPIAARVCPGCGYEIQGGAARTDSIVQRDGELMELSPEMVAAQRKQKIRELKSARTRDALVTLGESRHYKNPEYWADKILEERRSWAG